MPRVDITTHFYRCRQRDPSLFFNIVTPRWASTVAESEIKGAKVVTGRLKKKVKGKYVWRIQTVLIPRKPGMTRELAMKAARRIRRKLEGK